MPRPTAKHPTELELEILQVLWNEGPCTVKQIQEALAPGRKLAYTTVCTMFTIMTSKGYVRKSRGGTGQRYEAKVPREKAAGRMLEDLVRRVYAGSRLAAMQQLLDTSELDADEMAEIRRLIQRKMKEQK